MAGAPKIIVLSEQLRGKSFELVNDLYSVGRSDSRDICIKDPTISTHHCDFIKNEDTYIIRDNGSTNGTRVNNIPITEQVLQSSDIVQLGGIEVLYDQDDKSVATVMKTQTNIDFSNTDVGVATVKKMDEFAAANRSSKKDKSQVMLVGVVMFLVVVLLGLIIFIILELMGR